MLGKTELRLSQQDGRFYGLIDGKIVVDGDSADDVWRCLHDEAGKGNPKYVGFDGARNRFLHFFAGGFVSPNFVKEEREYKKRKRGLTSRLRSTGRSGKRVSAKPRSPPTATLTCSRRSKKRSSRTPFEARDRTLSRGAAKFASGELRGGLAEMEKALKPHGVWTAATYLPFLWRPEAHMFLKPEATKDFALRVGHRFAHDYEAKLDVAVYESLLDLVAKTEKETADLHPKDRIDVQSFIWVVGAYKDGQETPKS